MARRPANRREFLAGAAAGVLGALGACAGAARAQAQGDARLAARPAAPTARLAPGRHELALAASRNGLLYVPQSYRAEQPAPLVVLLHGAGGSAANWFGSYGPRAESLGVIALAPESRGATWDAVRGEFGADVRFIDTALRYVFTHCAVDPAHIAIAGFSDGASYALSLGLANGDLFTHVIAFSPGFMRRAEPAGKPPVFVSHGSDDRILPIASTSRVIIPDLRRRGYKVEVAEFNGGHEVPAAISDRALEWFLGR